VNILITGLSGSGKSSVGKELIKRGYSVVEADTDHGISSWVDIKTKVKVPHKPPYTKQWLKQHQWLWDSAAINKLLRENKGILFIEGGSHNFNDYLDLFDKKFALYIDNETMIQRLQKRNPIRWSSDKPEIWLNLEWNESIYDYFISLGLEIIDANQPTYEIANKILELTKK
jgi:adenylate kinase family enzyme